MEQLSKRTPKRCSLNLHQALAFFRTPFFHFEKDEEEKLSGGGDRGGKIWTVSGEYDTYDHSGLQGTVSLKVEAVKEAARIVDAATA